MTISLSDQVRDLMSTPVATIGLEATLREVAEELNSNEIGAVLVATDTHCVGIITERDVVIHIGDGANVDHLTAEEVLNSDLVTVSPRQSLAGAARAMAEAGVRHLPVLEVVDGIEEVVGVLSVRDLLGVLVASASGA